MAPGVAGILKCKTQTMTFNEFCIYSVHLNIQKEAMISYYAQLARNVKSIANTNSCHRWQEITGIKVRLSLDCD